MRSLIICDIDGVLADCSHRLRYLEERDYDRFYGIAMLEDTPSEAGIKLLRALKMELGPDLWLLTGRPGRTRRMTELWLKDAVGYSSYDMHMRADGDYRPSPIVKVKMLSRCKKELRNYDLIYYIDDDPENVAAVEKAFPNITGIVFGTKRFEK